MCPPIRVFIPIWYTAKGPLCRYNARLPCNLVEACTGNKEVHWCPGGKVILICLCIRMWLFSRGGYPYRCTPPPLKAGVCTEPPGHPPPVRTQADGLEMKQPHPGVRWIDAREGQGVCLEIGSLPLHAAKLQPAGSSGALLAEQ